jgi:hypothetical protein
MGQNGKSNVGSYNSLHSSRRNYEHCKKPQNMLLMANIFTRSARIPNLPVENSQGASFIFTRTRRLLPRPLAYAMLRETIRQTQHTHKLNVYYFETPERRQASSSSRDRRVSRLVVQVIAGRGTRPSEDSKYSAGLRRSVAGTRLARHRQFRAS